MEDTRPEVRRHDLIDREPRKLERRPIRVDCSSFRAQDDDGLRDRIDDPTQLFFIPAQLRFRSLQILDVRVDAVPLQRIARVVEKGLESDHEPAILAVVAPHSNFEVARLPRGQDLLLPLGQHARAVVRVKDGSEDLGGALRVADSVRFFARDAGVLMPALVEVVDGAIGAKAPHQGRDRIDDGTESVLRTTDVVQCPLQCVMIFVCGLPICRVEGQRLASGN